MDDVGGPPTTTYPYAVTLLGEVKGVPPTASPLRVGNPFIRELVAVTYARPADSEPF